MSKTSHLHRRGNVLYFRMSVPDRFRSVLKVSEFTESLRTESRKDAIPAAYALAAKAKTFFLYLDTLMLDDVDEETLRAAVAECNKLDKEAEAGKKKSYGNSLQKLMADKKHAIAVDVLNDRHQEELELMRIKTQAEAYAKLANLTTVGAPAAQQEPIVEKLVDSNAPLLSFAYDKFRESRSTNQTKLKTFKKLFIGFVGDKKIDLLTQKEVNQFFRLLTKCPGGRGDHSNSFSKLSLVERVAVAERENCELISLSAFDTTYKTAASQFFAWLAIHYEDDVQPLTMSNINYKTFGGLRTDGGQKQRALRIDEVEKLMGSFSVNSKMEHQFWLPMIALFSGGRVNEICQLNPQHDIVQDENSGIWFFNLTNEESGSGIKKSHKNDGSKRLVPIHSKLIECGFLDYFTRIRALGHDRIFNEWIPKDGRAASEADRFFRNYLKKVGLRDDKTSGRMVLGMHSLRGTFMSHTVRCLMKGGVSKKQAMSKIKPIVGHADGSVDEDGKNLSMTDGYIDDEIVGNPSNDLVNLKAVIEVLDYGIVFSNPIDRLDCRPAQI
jgi:integrase